jgi:hypothetical protein
LVGEFVEAVGAEETEEIYCASSISATVMVLVLVVVMVVVLGFEAEIFGSVVIFAVVEVRGVSHKARRK